MTGYVNIRDCGRDSHPIPSPNRAVSLKLPLCALALVLMLASVAYPQVLEGVITLPDTLGPLNGPYHLACTDDSAFPRLYIGGESDSGGVIVAEAITCKRLARIPTGPVKALCFVPPHNKLYVARVGSDSVVVVDCATNLIASTIHTASIVPVMQYNSQNDRLYCGGNSVTVIDCAADTVIHTIPVGATVFAIDSTKSKLYAGGDGPLAVVDCAEDTVVATIPLVHGVGALSFNVTAQKVYAASRDTLYAIQTGSDSIVARLSLAGLASVLTCDPLRNRVYCVYGTHFGSIDCAGDSVILTVGVGLTASFIACDVARDRLYLTFPSYSPEAFVYDATTGQYITKVEVDGIPSGAGWCPSLDRLYCLPRHYTRGGCLLAAVDAGGDSVAGILPLTMLAGNLSMDSLDSKLYFLYPGAIGCIGVADCARNIVTSYMYAGESPGPMCYNAVNNRLYFGTNNGSGIISLDCTSDTALRKISVTGLTQLFQLHDGLNKLYALAYDPQSVREVVNVIDCGHDSVMSCIDLFADYPRAFLLVPEDNRLWYLSTLRVTAIDCLGDSIVAEALDSLGSIDDACCSPEDRKIFAGWGGRPLWIVDMDDPARVETLQTLYDAGMRLCNVPSVHKVLWCANYGDPYPGHSVVRVIDSRTNAITATFRADCQVSGMRMDHTGAYVYCTGYQDSVLLVVDTRSDSLVASVELPSMGFGPALLNSRTNRIYVTQYDASDGIPVVHDSMSVGLEELKTVARPLYTQPTLVSRSVPLRATAFAELWDASGRRRAALRPGLNDISHLARGIYFGRGMPEGSTTKIIVVR